jgi:hypothetical protein
MLNIHEFIHNLDAYYKQVEKLAEKNSGQLIGFWGQPDQKTMDIFRAQGCSFIDVDVYLGAEDSDMTPKICCHIVKDIYDNIYHLKNKVALYIGTTGPDKCDQGRNVRDILLAEGIPVIDASNFNTCPIRPLLISTAKGPLKERVARITRLTFEPLTEEERKFYEENQCEPRFNFHGVPPRDLDLLDNFPEDTHIQGWTRLVELGVPGMVEWEWKIENSAPTVFFTQSFCNKEVMARYLAKKHGGLYIDCHNDITGSAEAKLQAFIRLNDRRAGNANL